MDTSDDETTGAAAETRKKTPKAAAAAKGKAAAGPKASAKESSLLKQKSPAEFFVENKNIAGFGNAVNNANDNIGPAVIVKESFVGPRC